VASSNFKQVAKTGVKMKLRDLELKQDYIGHTGLTVVGLKDFLTGEKILDDKVFLPTLGLNLQRDYCWNIQQKKEFVLAFIRRVKIPAFAFVINNNTFQVIDGKQRLNALLSFCRNEFALDNGLFFDDIEDKKHLLGTGRYGIVADVAFWEITDLQKIEWFNNINFKGTQQDIEHFNKIQLAIKNKDNK